MRAGFKIGLAFLILFSSVARASIQPSLVVQPRTMGMGGAGIGLADDDFALFHNPAGLAGSDERRFRLLSFAAEASLDTYKTASSSVSAFRNFSASTLNSFVGKDIYARAGILPMIRLPKFALAYIVDAQVALNGYNVANPSFDLGYQTTHGVQAGIGWSLSRGRRPRDEFRVGLAAKLLWRRGGYYDVGTSGFLAATNSGQAYLNDLVGSFGMGLGADLGAQYVYKVDRRSKFSAGASATDFTTTKFSSGSATPIEPKWGMGLGYQSDLDLFKMAFALDFRNLNHSASFSNKLHIGSEFTLPLMKLYLGLNQLNLTYGAAVDLGFFKAGLYSYGQEKGLVHGQNTSRRYMLSIDLNLPL